MTMPIWIRRARVVPLLFVLLACTSRGDDRDFSGVVTRVFDGDSFIVTSAQGRIEVRLETIDAPEKDQPHADVARAALIDWIEGQKVFVDVVDIDRFDRKVARVYREADQLDVIRALVRDGHVWVNRRYAKDPSLIALEDQAKERRAGLWALPSQQRIPPWEFRNQKFRRKPAERRAQDR
jgi:endonuclease YncB( thermonuclease family)